MPNILNPSHDRNTIIKRNNGANHNKLKADISRHIDDFFKGGGQIEMVASYQCTKPTIRMGENIN